MSKDWGYSEGERKYTQWFRSQDQWSVECALGQYPVIRAGIDCVRVYEGEEPIIQRIGTMEITMRDLTESDLEMAAKVQEFFTDLIGRAAEPMIKIWLNPPPELVEEQMEAR